MTFRTIPNGRLVDGAKLDNLPADVNAELASKADIVDLNAHKTDFNNPHSVTKSQVGLGNVDNTSDADKPVSTATQTALNAKEDKANKGQPNGYAPLDATGKVPAANLPTGSGTGDVVWPASSTDNALARFDSTTGKLIQNGVVTESDSGDLAFVRSVSLDTSQSGPTSVGQIQWNNSYGTAEVMLKGGNVKIAIGQEQVKRVVNKTWTNLTEAGYAAVYISGAQGQRMSVKLAQANTEATSYSTLGIVTENINDNNEGFITTSGEVNKINTTGSLQGETWADGDMLFLSPTVPGGLTKVKPDAPNHMVVIGYVEYAHAVNGKIFVKVNNGYELDELHNVLISSPSNGQFLKFDETAQVWKNGNVTGFVPTSTTVNGKALTGNITLTATDVWAPTGSGTSTGTNTGDQDLSILVPYTWAISDVNLGSKVITASKFNNVALTSGGAGTNYLADDGTYKAVSGGGSSLWTAISGTRTGNTTFTVGSDVTAYVARGTVVKWTESSVLKCGLVDSSVYVAWTTTVTIIGDTMASIDSSSLKYVSIPAKELRFAVAGSIGTVASNVANKVLSSEALRVLGAFVYVWTAGTTNSTTVDINKNGTSVFSTKPSLASGVSYPTTLFTADSGTSLAAGDYLTIDVDAIQSTRATDLYVSVFSFPTRILNAS